MKKRKRKDLFLNLLTIGASGLGVLVLGSLLWFLLSKGTTMINLNLITNPYWSKNYIGTLESQQANLYLTEEIVEGFYSERWGIGLEDEKNSQKESVIRVTYIHPDSPFNQVVRTGESDFNGYQEFKKGYSLEKIDYLNFAGEVLFTGKLLSESAEEVILNLEDAEQIISFYYKSEGGGIWGSVITTVYLIGVSLLIALPLGVGSAICLHEYSRKNKLNLWIRYGIETLTGVPSIIYGLMGVTVLFPMTQLLGATTTSILLGSMTMAIILLPIIMKSTEEALIVVPQTLRDGSYSLGATQFQTIVKVILPCAINGILTGVLLSVGRVIGESAALIYTMGTFISDSPRLLGQGTSLSLMIWSFMSQEQPNFELASAVSLIILVVVFSLNLVIKGIGKKFTKEFR